MRPSSGSILSKIKPDDFFDLLEWCSSYFNIDHGVAYGAVEALLHGIDAPASPVRELEDRWYASLSGEPDYSVYADPYYVCDIWACWVMYSRKAMTAIASPKSLVTHSVVTQIGKPAKIIDLGCGFGYSTAALKELFPSSRVFGTNLKDTWQFSVAEGVGQERGFAMYGSHEDVGPADLVVASEYFEHIQKPVEHLYSVIQTCKPRHLLIANGFNGRAIGHFTEYIHQGKRYSAREMSKNFWKALRMLGYEKIETKVWNNRPSLWQRQI